jgi:threonyl-tRNA synthetase
MRKGDLKQISNLIDERLDIKFDEKLINFATKDDLENSLDKASSFVKEEFDKNTKQHNEIFSRLDKIEEKIIQQPTRNEIFDKWDNKISQMSCDVDSLKYLHKDEWCNLPNRATIKKAI